MKRWTILLSTLVVLFNLAGMAQGQAVYFGTTGGMNIADMKIIGDGEDQDVNSLNRLGIGGLLGVRFGRHLSLQLRPLYMQKGGTMVQPPPSVDIDFLLSFLELDLTLKAVTGKRIRPYVLAGPTLGFLSTAEVEADAGGESLRADVKHISKKVEYGLCVGAGVEVPLWLGFLFVEGRYSLGLNNLSKGGTVVLMVDGYVAEIEEIDEDDEYKNRGFQIMAGYAISLKKR
jgi:hypothetical protein